MINLSFWFTCVLCGEKDNFYFTPVAKKTKTGDIVNSFTEYKIVCKKCGKNYKFKYRIER